MLYYIFIIILHFIGMNECYISKLKNIIRKLYIISENTNRNLNTDIKYPIEDCNNQKGVCYEIVDSLFDKLKMFKDWFFFYPDKNISNEFEILKRYLAEKKINEINLKNLVYNNDKKIYNSYLIIRFPKVSFNDKNIANDINNINDLLEFLKIKPDIEFNNFNIIKDKEDQRIIKIENQKEAGSDINIIILCNLILNNHLKKLDNKINKKNEYIDDDYQIGFNSINYIILNEMYYIYYYILQIEEDLIKSESLDLLNNRLFYLIGFIDLYIKNLEGYFNIFAKIFYEDNLSTIKSIPNENFDLFFLSQLRPFIENLTQFNDTLRKLKKYINN